HGAVHDSARGRLAERLSDLRGRFEGYGVVHVAVAKRLPQRAARDVLVGDVDVARIPRERVGALAPGMPQSGGRGGLTLGAQCRLAFARHDLECHLDAGRLVAGEPYRAAAAAAERLQRAVAAENKLARRDGESRF